jgi:hypothetical protein
MVVLHVSSGIAPSTGVKFCVLTILHRYTADLLGISILGGFSFWDDEIVHTFY